MVSRLRRFKTASALGLSSRQVLLDPIDKTGAQFLLFAMHRQYRDPCAETDDHVPAVTGFKRTALLLWPTLEFLADHRWGVAAQRTPVDRAVLGRSS